MRQIGVQGRAWVPIRLASNRLILKRIEKMEEACRLDVFCIETADFYIRYGRELCIWFRNNLDTVETQKSGKYKAYLRKTTWKVS